MCFIIKSLPVCHMFYICPTHTSVESPVYYVIIISPPRLHNTMQASTDSCHGNVECFSLFCRVGYSRLES